MAQILLHGTLHATIFDAESLTNPQRGSGGFLRMVSPRVVMSAYSFVRHLVLMMFYLPCPASRFLHSYVRSLFKIVILSCRYRLAIAADCRVLQQLDSNVTILFVFPFY